MIIHLTNEIAVKVHSILRKNNWWVSYLDHDFQIERIVQLKDDHLTQMSSDYRFDLGPCISCREQGKKCIVDDYFFNFIHSLKKTEA